MRVLCLLDGCPLPVRTGDDERLLAMLDVWASVATLDVIVRGVLTEAQRARLRDRLGGAAVEGLLDVEPRARGVNLGWLVHRTVPLDAAELDPRPARQRARRILHRWERPDAVFASRPYVAWLLRPATPPVPWFVDVPVVHGPSPWSVPVTSVGQLVRLVRDRSILELIRVDRAARFELREAGIAHLATVRTPEDREALGSPTAVAIADADIGCDYLDLVRPVLDGAGTYAPKGWS